MACETTRSGTRDPYGSGRSPLNQRVSWPDVQLDNVRLGLTFDDVLLVPQRSTVRSRQKVSVATNLSRNVEMSIPILAANMDTVCEWEMALDRKSVV